MTSWHSLPFEIKSQILAHYIDVSVPIPADVDISRSSYTTYYIWTFNQLTEAVKHVLRISPELKQEVTRIVKSLIAKRACLCVVFTKDLNAKRGPEKFTTWSWGLQLSRTGRRLWEMREEKRTRSSY